MKQTDSKLIDKWSIKWLTVLNSGLEDQLSVKDKQIENYLSTMETMGEIIVSQNQQIADLKQIIDAMSKTDAPPSE